MRSETNARNNGKWWLLLLVWPGAALAGDGDPWVPYAAAQSEYNTNVFALGGNEEVAVDPILLPIMPPGASAQPGTTGGDTARADTVLRYVAGLEMKLPYRSQTLRAAAEIRRYDYERFQRLDHDEYRVTGGFDWRTSRDVDGAFDVRQERRMASFADRRSTELTNEDERTITGLARVALTPSWQQKTTLRSRELKSPLPEFPEFTLMENSINAAINHLIVDALNAGVYVEYLKGKFAGVPEAGAFQQYGLGLTSDYVFSGISRIGAKLGYTRRQDDQDGRAPLSAVTGELSYHRDLTVKTSTDLLMFRRLRSFVGGPSSVQETGAGAAFAWLATSKISVTGTYQWANGEYEDVVSGSESTNAGRHDKHQISMVRMIYQMRPWISLRPHASYESRDSTSGVDSYDASIGGLDVMVQL